MDSKINKTFAFGLFLALFLKYMLYGFSYFPILDDYIQYGCYPMYQNVQDVFLKIGTVSTRPLASLLDPLFWGKMWNMMCAALLLITLLHFGTFVLANKTFKLNGILISPLFFILFLLFPATSEATYWISASSRLVVGMFFAILSLYLLTRFILRQKQWWFLALSGVSLLVCFGFYEQIALFGFAAYLLLLIYNRKKIRWKWIFCIPVVCAVLLGCYYLVSAQFVQNGSRASGFSILHLFSNILPFIRQLFETWIVQSGKIVFLGGYNGLISLLDSGIILALIFMILTAVSAAQIDSLKIPEAPPVGWPVCLAGAVLFLAPYLPNLLVEDVWLTNRSMFPSLIGLALMLEPLFQRAFRKPVFRTIFLMALIFLFIFSGLNEYRTYRLQSEYDQKIIAAIGDSLDDEVLAGNKKVAVLTAADDHIEQIAFYKDHVKSVSYSDWSLTGALRAYRRSLAIQQVELISDLVSVDGEALEGKQVFCIHFDGTVSVFDTYDSIY